MSIDRCHICREWVFNDIKHVCKPIYFASDEDDEDSWDVVYAYDEREAAKNFAEARDRKAGEGPTASDLFIKNPRTDKVSKFRISFERTVNYCAEEIT